MISIERQPLFGVHLGMHNLVGSGRNLRVTARVLLIMSSHIRRRKALFVTGNIQPLQLAADASRFATAMMPAAALRMILVQSSFAIEYIPLIHVLLPFLLLVFLRAIASVAVVMALRLLVVGWVGGWVRGHGGSGSGGSSNKDDTGSI